MEEAWLYYLRDPVSGVIRYVGKTVKQDLDVLLLCEGCRCPLRAVGKLEIPKVEVYSSRRRTTGGV